MSLPHEHELSRILEILAVIEALGYGVLWFLYPGTPYLVLALIETLVLVVSKVREYLIGGLH